jgi:hypothetical protein
MTPDPNSGPLGNRIVDPTSPSVTVTSCCCFVQSQHEVVVSCRAFAGLVERFPEIAELLSEVTRDCWARLCESTVVKA